MAKPRKEETREMEGEAEPQMEREIKGYRVSCTLPRGIRRGGRYWRFGEQEIGAGELAPAQLDALRQDPAFTVEAIHE